MRKSFFVFFAAFALVGCSSYRWTSAVPEDMRTVSVPTFRNETEVVELGSLATRQILREFQREGTFRLASSDAAAVEVQGVLKSAPVQMLNYKRGQSMRAYEHRFTLNAEVSVVDRRSGKVVADNRVYSAETTFFSDTDSLTARRDASARLAEDLARQIVDDVVAWKWEGSEKKKGSAKKGE